MVRSLGDVATTAVRQNTTTPNIESTEYDGATKFGLLCSTFYTQTLGVIFKSISVI